MPFRPVPPTPPGPPPPLIVHQVTLSPAPSPTEFPHHRQGVLPPLAAACSFLFFVLRCFRKVRRERTAPSDAKPPHRFSYSSLRHATNSFSSSNILGQGGFGSVFRGTLPNRLEVAVKVMDSGSLQGEREFQNELFFASKVDSPHVVSVLGFSSDRKRRRMLLVYELVQNGNLQDALLHRKCAELMEWKKRFSITIDIAKGIEYLHNLNPPVIHGDIKPSNVLLDRQFSAKIADFGLARLKSENQYEITVDESDGGKVNDVLEVAKKAELESNGGGALEDYGSVVEDTESITTGFEEFSLGVGQSPEGFSGDPTSPETLDAVTASPETVGIVPSPGRNSFDGASVESVNELGTGAEKSNKGMSKGVSAKDWWWKQENGTSENGKVKDYVMEWIGTEIKKERPKSDWIGASSSSNVATGKLEKKKNKRHKQRFDWWLSLDEDSKIATKNLKKENIRPAREWWKEEYCGELERKKKKKKEGVVSDNNGEEDWWPRAEELYVGRKKKNRSSSRGSIDWWLDGLSGEFLKGRGNSRDSISGEIPNSGGISSTPSMRGTICYVAPEYGGGDNISEKCDVYSFGVLLLVLIAGRRPLQVAGSPKSEFQRANLISWARLLARTGKLLDLVDKNVQSLDREQAHLCITIALLCLQKSPARRPSMKDVVGMLSGDTELPQLPTHFSPSPRSRLTFKSNKKAG
ncbi:receptor-like serine/threonine-protein kinase [Tripterygium wilfordii]|uniref:non-specific serine/threonine protein kinase n=1 Tax=Tripterygium wilfordii TaxID=458696 RepID=A0A7J7DB46_TRIWF|nr:receptor-like serine/threonine-protein kinase At4g25390 [Tripterygium wilfordii]KAF5743577.1 receptor-like serine/threonine-protein kinase [Tripterygium wilfordii]